MAKDANFSNVSLLLHCDGADGSTVFTDNSPAPNTVTATGNAKISTAQSKFGGASLLLGGAGEYLRAPANTDYIFGTGDFTVELWINTTTTAEDVLVDQYLGANSWQLSVKAGKLSWYGKSDAYVLTSLASVNDGTWHHVAATREAGVLRFFVDGAASGQATDTTGYSQSIALGIGAQVASRNSNYDYAGYIDDLRVTKGLARYTANFTPPIEQFSSAIVGAVMAPPQMHTPAPERARIAADSPVPPHSAASAPPLLLARDVEFGGTGRIYGTTKIETSPTVRVPTKARVSILRGHDKLLVREVWSDPATGAWEAAGLDTRQDFVVLAQDAAGNYQPVAADKTMPEETP